MLRPVLGIGYLFICETLSIVNFNFESSNISRCKLSWEIGRIGVSHLVNKYKVRAANPGVPPPTNARVYKK